MRVVDLMRLAVESLWLQKTRALLNTVGVVIGAFLLLAAFAAGDGIQRTVQRMLRSQDYLRTILVSPKYVYGDEAAAPLVRFSDKVPIEKQNRLRRRLIEEWQMQSAVWNLGPLLPDAIDAIRAIPNVESVTPRVMALGLCDSNGFERHVAWEGCAPQDRRLERRLVAGQLPQRNTISEVAISEYLAFIFGYESEQEVEQLIGLPLTFRTRVKNRELQWSAEFAARQLSGASQSDLTSTDTLDVERLTRAVISSEEMQRMLEQLTRIPEILQAAELDDDVVELMETLVSGSRSIPPEPADGDDPDERVFTARVVGVIRDENPEDPRDPFDLSFSFAGSDAWFHEEAAVELFRWYPDSDEQGFPAALVKVSTEQDLENVSDEIQALGFDTRSLLALLNYLDEQTELGKRIVLAIAATIFLIAGLGITNTMVMSVVERRFEIGIMKSLGATQLQIVAIFLCEAFCIGVAGSSIAWAAAALLGHLTEASTQQLLSDRIGFPLNEPILHFSPGLVLSVSGFSCLITMLATLLPAWRAARVNPIDSIRTR